MPPSPSQPSALLLTPLLPQQKSYLSSLVSPESGDLLSAPSLHPALLPTAACAHCLCCPAQILSGIAGSGSCSRGHRGNDDHRVNSLRSFPPGPAPEAGVQGELTRGCGGQAGVVVARGGEIPHGQECSILRHIREGRRPQNQGWKWDRLFME